MKKLYIDIDGVLLTIKNTQQPQYAVEFIDYITSAFECYWLTSHCKEGNNLPLLQYLSPYYDDKTIDKLNLLHQMEHIVLTDPMKGITKEVADKVISILNKEL